MRVNKEAQTGKPRPLQLPQSSMTTFSLVAVQQESTFMLSEVWGRFLSFISVLGPTSSAVLASRPWSPERKASSRLQLLANINQTQTSELTFTSRDPGEESLQRFSL